MSTFLAAPVRIFEHLRLLDPLLEKQRGFKMNVPEIEAQN